MATLNWIGKEAVVNHDKEVAFKLLEKVPSASVGKESKNLIIHGDNLEALKALMPFYKGKVKCIYIDPPYNTGNDGWVYNDKVNSPKIADWIGKVVGSSGEDLTRHDKWLCMMYPRLTLLKDLLKNDGAIFISIDDNEVDHLKQLCDEIFGEKRLIGIFTWVRKKKGSNLSKEFRKITEYILAYRGGDVLFELFGESAYSEKQVPLLNRPNGIGRADFPANAVVAGQGLADGLIKKGSFGKGELVVDLLNDIHIQNGKIVTPFSLQGRFRWSQRTINEELKNGSIFYASNTFRINVARHNQAEKFKSPSSLLTPEDGIGTNEDATNELRILFPENEKLPFDYPKPTTLVKHFIKMLTFNKNGDGEIILDSFAGSGTAAHAVMEMNKEDGGNRKYILVEMEDAVAKKITAERVRRAIKKYSYKDGFEYCELAKPLFNEKGQINDACTYDELATYIYFTETQTNADKKNIKPPFVGESQGVSYYLIYTAKNKNDLTRIALNKLKITGPAVIYADRCLIDEDELKAKSITFKQIPYEIKIY